MDILNKIYQGLISDALILEKVEERFKYYTYPETGDVSKPYIIIHPLAPPSPDDYADNQWLTEESLIQIDVWAKTRADKDLLGARIQQVMWKMGFGINGTGIDEYDESTGIYRDGRRYNCKVYTNELIK